MFTQSFSLKNLAHLLKRGEGYRYGYRGNRKAIKAALSPTVQALNESSFAYENISIHPTAKGSVFSTKNLGCSLVQRKLNENIKVLYKVKQANRDLIIRQIRALLCEPVPKHIIKMDIARFYESIDRIGIVNKLLSDQLLSIDSKRLIRDLYAHASVSGGNGLHRGVCTSSSLSELYMRSFDKEVPRMDGVYFYARYVDDIVIFVHSNPKDIFDRIENNLEQEYGLKLNPGKSNIFTVGSCRCRDNTCNCQDTSNCVCKDTCICKKEFKQYQSVTHYPPHKVGEHHRGYRSFDYLGYKFFFPPIVQDPKFKCKVFLSIADKKVEKIKSRIANAVVNFERDGNYNLLKDRIEFLTSNYRVSSRKGSGLYAGIFYNYRYIDLSTEDSRKSGQYDALDNLDNYVRNILFCKKLRLGRRMRGVLGKKQKDELAAMTFKQGWKKRFFSRFSQKEINAIAKAWVYEKN